ncbi:MAG: hypothetical protein ACXIUD_05275 [Mongoliitalea sp.]
MKLQDIPTGYKSFADNQLLTAAQLNLLIQYLDTQDRMSRLSLTGAGIICGLEPSFRNGVLRIQQGTALTTDGDLLKLRSKSPSPERSPIAVSNKEFTAYLPFTNHRVRYNPFMRNPTTEIPILELLTAEEAKNFSEARPLSTLSINNFVVVLYVENFTKPYDVCNDTDCDSQGIPEIFNLRYFLIDREDVLSTVIRDDQLFQRFSIQQSNLEKIQEIHVPRVTAASLLGPQNNFRLTPYQTVINNTVPTLTQSSLTLFDYLVSALGLIIPANMRRLNFIRITQSATSQYDYGFLQDLVATYNELLNSARAADAVCNLDPTAFPKHILLGAVQDTSLRHGFYKSPALATDPQLREKIQSLVDRYQALLNSYRINTALPVEIRPSKISTILSDKAIPRYYVSNPVLRTSWSFGLSDTRIQMENSEDRLLVDLTGKDFFRIEGAFQKNWATGALQVLQEKKRRYGLNFDVVCLSSEGLPSTFDYQDYPVFFQDLQTMLITWRDQQSCLFSLATSFLTGFSKEANGGHGRFKDLLDLQDINFGVVETAKIDPDRFKLSDETLRILESMVNPQPSKEPPKEIVGSALLGVPFTSLMGAGTVMEPTKTVYRKNVATESLVFSKGTNDIGNAFEAINFAGNLSVNDLVANFDRDIRVAIPDINQWNTTDRQLRVTLPTRLLAAIAALLNQVPNELNEITAARLVAYENALNELCQVTQSAFNYLSGLLTNPQQSYQRQGFEDQYLSVLNRLKENCCAGDFLKALFSEALIRRARILQELTFPAFARKHPGLEHFAGVPNGGTFVLVYDPKTNRVIADFSLPYLCCSKGASIAMIVTPPVDEQSPLEFSIQAEFCKSASATAVVPFTLSPEGTEIQLVDRVTGASIRDNELVLTSSFRAFNTAIQFNVGGELSDQSIVIREIPSIALKHEFDAASGLHVIHSSVQENSFEWTLNGRAVGSNTSEKLELKSVADGTNVVRLTVRTPCGEVSQSITFTHETSLDTGDCTKLALGRIDELKAELSRTLSSRFTPRDVRDDLIPFLNAVQAYEKDPETFVNGRTILELTQAVQTFEVLRKRLSGNTNENEVIILSGIVVLSMQIIYTMLGCVPEKVMLEFEKDLLAMLEILEELLKEPVVFRNLQQVAAQLEAIAEFRIKQGFDSNVDPLIVHLLRVLRLLRGRR